MQFNRQAPPDAGDERAAREDERSVRRTALRGAWGIVAFWLAMLAGMYLIFDQVESRKQVTLAAHVGAAGELVIPRGRDGHFRVSGTVNGQPVQFLVDTGASLVTVSEGLAQAAGLRGGQPASFRTANGELPGRVVRGVPVEAGGAHVGKVNVAVGLVGRDEEMALLGQNFLYRFDIAIGRNEMVLRPRTSP
jgi:aspartyl protease family protein